jgi:hypothetical protein
MKGVDPRHGRTEPGQDGTAKSHLRAEHWWPAARFFLEDAKGS